MFDIINTKFNNTIKIERNGYEFQVGKNPFCRFRYKGKKKQVIGYRYHLGMHLIAGHAHMGAVEGVKVGEKVVWEPSDILKDSHSTIMTSLVVGINTWYAQTFTISSSYTITSLSLMMNRVNGSQPGTITVSIRATDIYGRPTGEDLCYGTTNGNTLPEIDFLSQSEWREIQILVPIILQSGLKYAVCVRCEALHALRWICSYGNLYSGGDAEKSIDGGETWPEYGTGEDFTFKIYSKQGTAPNCSIYINKPNIFGGDRKEGGVQGNVNLNFGDITQSQDSYLLARLGNDIPAFRGVFAAVLRQVYLGTTPYLKPWSFLCKRVSRLVNGDDQWYRNKAVINPRASNGDDLNGIHIIRECLTDREWGLGFDSSTEIGSSFEDCADTLFEEEFGLSLLWDQVMPLEEFINDILDCIAGVLYQDLSTGKWEVGLIRDNYNLDDLEVFNEDDIIEIEEFTRPTYGEIINQVVVNWWDKINNKTRSAIARDNSLIEKQGNTINETILNFQGICNASLANKVAERELNIVTAMLAGLRLRCTRKMSHLKPNDVFKLTWSKLGLVQMVVRILDIDYGSLENNEIVMNCVEDSFAAPYTIYADSPDTLWTSPVSDPTDVVNVRILEIPYYTLVNDLFGSINLVAALNDDNGFLFVLAERPTSDHLDFDLLVRFDEGYDFKNIGTRTFVATGVLTNDLVMNCEDTTIDLSEANDLDLVGINSIAVLNNEIIKILSIDTDNNQIEIARGVLDTTPKAHLSGDRIYFVNEDYAEIDIEYLSGNNPDARLLTRTGNGILDEVDATIITSPVLGSRMIRPYPPGNLKFNGESFPSFFSSTENSKLTISWNHRDRTDYEQLQKLIEHSDSIDYGPEAGTTYTIKIYDENNNLVRTASGVSGKSYDYTEAFELSDCGSLQTQLRFVIYSVRDGYNSWGDGYDITIRRAFRAEVNAVCSVTGELIPYFDGRHDCTPNSSVNGHIELSQELYGLISGESNLYGFVSGMVKNLNSSVSSNSSISGSLTIPIIESLKIHYNEDDGASEDGEAGIYTTRWEGQTFIPNESFTITSLKIMLSADSDASGKTATISIRATSGGLPIGDDLCSGTLDGNLIGIGNKNRSWHEIDFGEGCLLNNGVQYVICCRSDEISANIMMWVDLTSPIYTDGTRVYSNNSGVDWSSVSGNDFLFEIYGG
jgi:hypothetical protein